MESIKMHLSTCLNILDFEVFLHIQVQGELLTPLVFGIDGIWVPSERENVVSEDLHLLYRGSSSVDASCIIEVSLFVPNSDSSTEDENVESSVCYRTILSATVYALRNFLLEKGMPFLTERDIGIDSNIKKVILY